ncbi:M50 family metallopeptidase [Luteipulveratus sp. YIM 133132]|uniref:M50 family metallopeptidase n=1 Tax=Luteipulveratus flavus TaxID=3031728 RepID=A0ABT6C630_9MICO|nr:MULTISPECIES: M50 family metallopeptidase [unclassified Luteipulveratus]MDE9366417.1 M50 family metallopeptidase [Luteipulveratus sp. YIM 133132]MDF8264308.1 M50 family metallopeptidase [Luteipulveratus sp. YIM 133296]
MGEIWDRITTVQPLPARGVIELMGVIAIGLILWPPAWRVTRQVVTIAHEGAHAFVALLCGRSLHGVRLHRDTSGLTVTRGLARGRGLVATLAAGYIGPALLGLLGAVVLGRGYSVALLWLLLIVLALLLLQIRNWFGLGVMLVAGAVLFGVTWWMPGQGQTAFAYLLMWFLLLASPWAVVDLQRSRRRGRGYESDADQLGRLTVLPGLGWVTVFFAVTVGCLVVGALMMLGRLT